MISVGASVSKDTWAADYGSAVDTKYAMMPFSSRGPREDGGFTPTLTAPGASVNTVPTWEPGAPVAEAGYQLPPGYAMLQGTSMASPQATGAAALLISAAKERHHVLPPAELRTALTSTAKKIKGVQAYAQGAGLIDVNEAWEAIGDGVSVQEYTVKAPVKTSLAASLKTPGFGTGLYDREGGLKTGENRTYDISITRTTGPDRPIWHELGWKNNDGTFRIVGDDEVRLPLNRPVTVKVRAKARTAGVHSAILTVDDDHTWPVDKQILTTVVAAQPLAKPSYALKESGSVQRNATTSYFVNVPKGAKSLEVAMSGLRSGSQTRWIAISPYGVPADPTSTPNCYPNYPNPANTCRPELRSYPDPLPGVWEFEVEARRTSPHLDNPFTLTATALGAAFDPAERTIPEAKAGTPTPVSWTVTNGFAAIEGKLRGGQLGSSVTDRPTIKQGEARTTKVTLGAGVTRLDASIGRVSDAKADLDLSVYKDGKVVASSTKGDSEESVSLSKPAAGEYTIEVTGYSVPGGSTAYDYRDVYFAPSLGELRTDESKPVHLASGAKAEVGAELIAATAPPAGRALFGEAQLLTASGTVAGSGAVKIEKVVG